MERWHSMTARQVMEKLGSGPEGLSDGEAAGGWSGTGQINWTRPGGRPCCCGCWGSFRTP